MIQPLPVRRGPPRDAGRFWLGWPPSWRDLIWREPMEREPMRGVRVGWTFGRRSRLFGVGRMYRRWRRCRFVGPV